MRRGFANILARVSGNNPADARSALLQLTMAVGPFDPAKVLSKSKPTLPILKLGAFTGSIAVALAATAWFTVRSNWSTNYHQGDGNSRAGVENGR